MSATSKVTRLIYNFDGNIIGKLAEMAKTAEDAEKHAGQLRRQMKAGEVSAEEYGVASAKAAKAIRDLQNEMVRTEAVQKNLGEGTKKLGSVISPMAGDIGDLVEGFSALAEGGGGTAVVLGGLTLGLVALTGAVVGGVKAFYSLAQGAVDAKEDLLLPYEIAERVGELENKLNASAEAGNRLSVSMGVIASEQAGGRVISTITGITDALAEAISKSTVLGDLWGRHEAFSDGVFGFIEQNRGFAAQLTGGGSEVLRHVNSAVTGGTSRGEALESLTAAQAGAVAASEAAMVKATELQKEQTEAATEAQKAETEAAKRLAEEKRKAAEAVRDAERAARDGERSARELAAAEKALAAKYAKAIVIQDGMRPEDIITNVMQNGGYEHFANAGTTFGGGDPRAEWMRAHPGTVFSATDMSPDMPTAEGQAAARAAARQRTAGGIAAGLGAASAFQGGGVAGGVAGVSAILSMAGPMGGAIAAGLGAVMKPKQSVNDLISGMTAIAEKLPGAIVTLVTEGLPKLLQALPKILAGMVQAIVEAILPGSGKFTKQEQRDFRNRDENLVQMSYWSGGTFNHAQYQYDQYLEEQAGKAGKNSNNAKRGKGATQSASKMDRSKLGGTGNFTLNYQGLAAPTEREMDTIVRRFGEVQGGRGRDL